MASPAEPRFAFTNSMVPKGYDEYLVPSLFTPWAEALVARLAPATGIRALDVATGPGTVAIVLARTIGPKGQVAACDGSPGMLERARAKVEVSGAAPIAWTESPAAPLPYPDHSFSLVTCQQGLQFFPDGGAALGEMRRVLDRGGRLGVSVWHPIEACLPFHALWRAFADTGHSELARLIKTPFPLWTAEDLGERAREAGFGYIRVVEESRDWVIEGGTDAAFHALTVGTPVAPVFAALPPDAKAAIAAKAQETFQPLRSGTVVRGPMRASILLATA